MYILKVSYKSKYFGFKKVEYIEFLDFLALQSYIVKKNLKDCFEVYIKI